jgi:hypothetical protein
MHIQRIFVIFLSFIGIIATFLPWFSVNNFLVDYSINGLNRNGWFINFLLAQCILFSFIKDWKKPLSGYLIYSTIFFSLLASFIVIYDLLTLDNETDNLVGRLLKESISIEIGVYLLVSSGISIPLVILFFKNK